MKKLMMALALAGTALCLAQDTAVPEKKRPELPTRKMRSPKGRGPMMGPMRARVKSFGKLADEYSHKQVVVAIKLMELLSKVKP